jgi:hypothetical protein
MSTFAPHVQMLPPAQRRLWAELAQVPKVFVLYGGTAIGLWLGHRPSEDFDFFSSDPFVPADLLARMPFLTGGLLRQSEPNTLTLTVDRAGPVKVSFFGGLRLGRVGEPRHAPDTGLLVASRLDLAATKVAVVQQRAEQKDYLDLAALLRTGIGLADMLGAASAIYGRQFNPLISLKALSYFDDGDLAGLPDEVKDLLSRDAAAVREIPEIHRRSDGISPGT